MREGSEDEREAAKVKVSRAPDGETMHAWTLPISQPGGATGIGLGTNRNLLEVSGIILIPLAEVFREPPVHQILSLACGIQSVSKKGKGPRSREAYILGEGDRHWMLGEGCHGVPVSQMSELELGEVIYQVMRQSVAEAGSRPGVRPEHTRVA